MRNVNTLLIIGASAVFFMVGAGCSQAPDESAAAAEDESPEFAAVEYRQGLMHVMAFKADPVRNMADGSMPVDEALFAKSAADLAAAAGMITEGFIPGSSAEDKAGSGGLPDIWSNWDDFLAKAAALETAATEISALAAQGGFAAAQEAAGELGANCGGCHRPYRQR
jgi:cytochrome c556